MTEEAVPYGRKTQKAPAISDVHIVWILAGLGCDGDTISITAVTQPSIEEVVLGAIPGLPKVHLHNPDLAFEVGGVRRGVNIGMLDDIKIGDWVLVHVGFAMSKIDEQQAAETLQTLHELGAYEEELQQFQSSIN